MNGLQAVNETPGYLDFARGLVTLGTHDAAFGQAWHLPSAETLTTQRCWRSSPWSTPPCAPCGSRRTKVQRPFVVDHAKFAGAFGTSVTPHREAISLTFEWFQEPASVA